MSIEAFLSEYPTGKIPRQSADFGKTFVCRRGCNTRTASYTEQFIWEELYQDGNNVFGMIEFIKENTKATRQRRRARSVSIDDVYLPPETPTKATSRTATTPQGRRIQGTPGSRSTKKSVNSILGQGFTTS
jgi:origin recognition complex subunit 1